YRVGNKVTVVVKDLKVVPALLADAIDSGANGIDGVDFQVENPRKYKDEARKLALIAAREKADAMASEMHSRVGKVLSIKETGSRITGLLDRGYYSGQNAVYQSVSGPEEEDGAGLAAGQLKINSTVSVTFELTD